LPPVLHLDAARLGLMSPSAQRHQQAFARLAGDPRSALYWREFLGEGWEAWPDELRDEFPDLQGWRGTPHLGRRVQRLLEASSKTRVELASRSGVLFSLAASRLATRTKRILVVDTLWLPYRRRLRQACRRHGADLLVCRLRDLLGRLGCAQDAIVEHVVKTARTRRTGGIVLPVVDHLGVMLPIEQITRRLRSEGVALSVIVDASQAVGHVPMVLRGGWCDTLVAGAHKWLGGGNPLGFSVTEPALIEQGASESAPTDPLYRFTEELAGRRCQRWGETAGTAALLTAAGALQDGNARDVESSLPTRMETKRTVAEMLRRSGWSSHAASEGSRTGVLVARPGRRSPSVDVGVLLRRHGIVASTTQHGAIRFSMPARPLTGGEAKRLAEFFGALRSERQNRLTACR